MPWAILGLDVPVDVETEVTIEGSRAEVVAHVSDPSSAPAWYVNIQRVDWETEPPLAVGSRVAFVARFLGRTLSYTYEVTELVPGERPVMRNAEGPLPMETTYTWEDIGGDRTRMWLRNRGEPSGFARLGGGMIARAMRKANKKDLAVLKAILEG